MTLSFETNKRPANRQKLRGGYYTPLKLADYLARWSVRSGTERILEPSAGDGNFVVAALNQLSGKTDGHGKSEPSIVAVEIEREEILKARNRIDSKGSKVPIEWICDDFFAIYEYLKKEEQFDVVLGNPPFIRFQYFADDSREEAFRHLRQAGYKPTKLANAWVAFVQLSIGLLRDGGRLSMVVPAELLQVKYAAELRTRLSREFEHIVLIGFRRLVFPEIQQEVLLLLAEGKRSRTHLVSEIHTVEFEDGSHLVEQGDLNSAIAHFPSRHSRNGMKWTALFMSNRSFEALDEAEQSDRLVPLGELAQVAVGIVTGRNSFFVLTEELRDRLSVSDFTVPIIGRTSALKSVIFDRSDFEQHKAQYPSYLLNLTDVDLSQLSADALAYLESGEREGVASGYKCRIRPRWYDVPSVYIPNAFLFRQIHRYPLLVMNDAKAACTDTIHRVLFKPTTIPRLLTASFFNSLTLAWAEVCGRSYGGGVLELEPREAEQLPIAYDENLDIDIQKVDCLLRQGKDKDALDYVDDIVLKGFLGFDNLMIRNIRFAWTELRERRMRRR